MGKINVITVFVYTPSYGDCTAEGVTSKNKSLYLFAEYVTRKEIEEFRQERNIDKSACLRVVKRENPIYGSYAEVVYKEKEGAWMSGGNFVYTSDSRYFEVTNVRYPISVHDRCESWEQYDQMSR